MSLSDRKTIFWVLIQKVLCIPIESFRRNRLEFKLVHVSGSVRGTKCGLDAGTCIEKRDGGHSRHQR